MPNQNPTKCEVRREKVKQFRQAVQEMGVRPWMFRLLAREMYGKTDDTSDDESVKEQKKGKRSEKKEKYLQTCTRDRSLSLDVQSLSQSESSYSCNHWLRIRS